METKTSPGFNEICSQNNCNEQLTLKQLEEYLLTIFKRKLPLAKKKHSINIVHDKELFICEYRSKNLNLITGLSGFFLLYLGGPITLNGVLLTEEQTTEYLKKLKE